MPSWHAGEWEGKSLGRDVAKTLQGSDGKFKLSAKDVMPLIENNRSLKSLAEAEIDSQSGVSTFANHVVELFEGNGGNRMNKSEATELLEDIGKQVCGLLYGEKFSKENT
ncbi:MAG: hypothetical protein GY822_27845 [Deltaproteobacteria bacterium]|nr:hypothetical protein [Deltaproteobacteria bacterium]